MFPQYSPSYPLLRRDNVTQETVANQTIPINNTTTTAQPDNEKSGSGSAFPSFLIAIIVVGAVAAIVFAALIIFRRRASKRRAFGDQGGLSIDGAKQGLSSFWYRLKNPRARSTSAGFEGISAGRAGNRNTGRALDPDEAWDSRVGREADGYYEDTELQGTTMTGYVNTGSTEYVGASGRAGMPVANPFGDDYASGKRDDNPFGDEHAAAPALRSVSPRPFVETADAGHSLAPSQTSPSRKSVFKEDTA